MTDTWSEIEGWFGQLRARVPSLAGLLDAPAEARNLRGYDYTIAEILQQPVTWNETAARVAGLSQVLRSLVFGSRGKGAVRAVMLTGSGSSNYVGECVAPALQSELGLPVRAIGGGDLLTHPDSAALPGRPCLLVSIARSGNSPESAAAVEHFLETEPECRHLFLTCNSQGRLATAYRDDGRTRALVLDDRTNDRSLVMTGSFTNLVLASRFLGFLDRPDEYREVVDRLGKIARALLLDHADVLAEVANDDFRYAVYLGAGCRYGAAREAGLKLMEMSAGRVRVMAETYLGLRHGPMAAIHDDTLIVCFLSGDPHARAYEMDLIRELNGKGLGRRKIIVGEGIAQELLHTGDVAVDCPGLKDAGDENAPVIDVLAGQLLAFHHCLATGLRPDSPSPEGVISRVVKSFRIHKRMANDE